MRLRALFCLTFGHRWASFVRYQLGVPVGIFERCDRCDVVREHARIA